MSKITKYKAAVLSKYGQLPKIQELELRPLEDNEILVKIMISSIMPADTFAINGAYGLVNPELPSVFGFEGSGIIEEVGKSISKDLIGKHVGTVGASSVSSSTLHANWAQYFIGTLQNMIVFDKPLDFDKIFASFVNPITVLGFIDVLKKQNAKSVVQNGASTLLGKQFIRVCNKEGIEVINIVRRENSVEDLKKIGGKHFIISSEEGWEKKLTKLAESLNAKHVIECVGGENLTKILVSMPNGTTIYHYGNLEGKYPTDLPSGEFIFKQKTLTGFWLSNWIKEISQEEFMKAVKYVKDDLENGGELFSSDYREVFSLDEFDKAILSYKTNSGRVLLKPWG